MASGKKTPTRKSNGNQKKAAPEKVPSRSKAEETGRRSGGGAFVAQFAPYVLGVLAVLIAVCLISGAGVVGGALKRFLLGVNGAVAFSLPLFLILHAVTLNKDLRYGYLIVRAVSSVVSYTFISVLVHVLSSVGAESKAAVNYPNGVNLIGGGAIGGGIGGMMTGGFGKPGTLVIVFAILIVSVLLMFGFTPRAFARMLRERAKERAEMRAAQREAERIEPDQYPIVPAKRERRVRREKEETPDPAPVRFRYRRKKPFTPDIPLDDDYPEDKEAGEDTEEKIFEEAMARTKRRRLAAGGEYETPDAVRGGGMKRERKTAPSDKAADEEKEAVRVKRTPVGKPADEETKKYVFPPVDLLPRDEQSSGANVREELQENGNKLVETLRSFNVRTRIEDIQRGPTITRYELLPEPGTRVRSIINLVDDISLNLATTGVRIEAPVPGKAVVGIEVPNKNKSVVHLRTLIESKKFTENPSKLFCALGEDVAGEAVFLDIGKMPHLLIAGATGMGKSVCINSIVVSLLYKATPEEVKLIMIDPKKVEFNIYNGIPHLLVPVVTDPKKAAGSLSWAVSEMERRFGLIEAVGVREITAYNKATANDPDYEYLPYIVIIIDELADLMMTAPDNVEDSICRLMQKARAAGMHVIIGTQRPSVDVITGLIKANIPSRIACTVASQVDSRTILDRAGAENLIGRGDMLYLPVSASKPIRVQGAFVHENDVENIVTYIKDKNREEAEYSKEVIDKIEEAARNVGNKKKGAPSLDGEPAEADDDPMLRDALELAVTTGKISTSLIQRKLSLGYGRAAKLIDRMQELGFVSEPSGQKPREVLITKEQFMEMIMRNDNVGNDEGPGGSDGGFDDYADEEPDDGTAEEPDDEFGDPPFDTEE